MFSRIPVQFLIVIFCVLLIVAPAQAATSSNLLVNGGFESGMTGWTVTGAAGDKRLCNALIPVAYEGTCQYQFKGDGGVTTLSQVVGAAGLLSFNSFMTSADAYLKPVLFGRATELNKVSPSMKVTVVFSDGNSSYKLKFTDGPEVLATDAWLQDNSTAVYVPAGSQATKVVFTLSHSAPNGKIYVDNVQLILDTNPL